MAFKKNLKLKPKLEHGELKTQRQIIYSLSSVAIESQLIGEMEISVKGVLEDP